MDRPTFKTAGDGLDFRIHVQHFARYVLEDPYKEFLKILVETAKGRTDTIPTGTVYYRARNDFETRKVGVRKKQYPLRKEKMRMPLADLAEEGRINPFGIPALYLAEDERTAIAEARPLLRELVTVAEAKLLSEIRVVNAIQPDRAVCSPFKEEATDAEKESRVWYDVDNIFSDPVNRQNGKTVYFAAQYLAEIFKANKWDGIKYRSSMREDGISVALFSPRSIEFKNLKLVRVSKVNYEYQLHQNDYRPSKRKRSVF